MESQNAKANKINFTKPSQSVSGSEDLLKFCDYFHLRAFLPKPWILRYFYGKSEVLHLCEGPELRTQY